MKAPLALDRKQYVLETFKSIPNFSTYLAKRKTISGCLLTSEVIIWLIMDPAETEQVLNVLVNQDTVG